MKMKIKLARFGSIFILNLIVKEIIDLILTPILIIELGFVVSFLTTVLIYIIIGIVSVNIYDSSKTDCLWIEGLKESQHNGSLFSKKNRLTKFIEKWMKKNRKLLGLLLSFKNPGLMVVWERDGFSQYNGFTGKNIKLRFLINTIVINIYWYILLFTGFSIWEFLKSIF